jgi:hypothetical protein
VLTGVQFYDYTKQPVLEALIQNPPSSKFDVFLEAVGHAYVPLFTNSEAYLAPNGTYISVGPTPDGFVETMSLLWNVFMHPKWAGGTKRQYEYVPAPPQSSLFHTEGKLLVQQTTQGIVHSCRVVGRRRKDDRGW